MTHHSHDDRSPAAGSAARKRRSVGRWGALAVRVVPGLLELAVAALIAVSVISLPLLLAGALETNRKWREAVPRPTASVLTRVDFGRLVAAGIVWFDRATFMLGHASCDGLAQTNPSRMREGGASPPGLTGDSGARTDLLNLLCDTGQGKAIREEIASWNLSFDLLAVRDNRAVNQTVNRTTPGSRGGLRLCADTDPVLPHYVQRGCFPSAWEARYLLPDGKTFGTALGRAGAAPPTDSFGFLAATPVPYAGDWWLATPNETAPGEVEAGRYLLTTTIPTGGESVVVQVIGDLTAIEVQGAASLPVDDALLDGNPRRVGAHTLGVRRQCDEDEDTAAGEDRTFREEVCRKKPPEGEPVAYRIEIRRAQTAAPAASVNLTLSARPIRLKPKEFSLSRTPHLHVRCPAADAGACAISWEDPAERKPTAPGSAPAVSSTCPPPPAAPATKSTGAAAAKTAQQKPKLPTVYDRSCTVPLADDQGVMTEAARVAGLSDVVGLGPAAYQTLSARVAHRTPEAGAVKLSIDMDLQRRAQAALDASGACRSAALCQGVDCRSRGMFVVVDAGDDDRAGEILASATCPGPPEGLNAWDLAVLDRSRPGASPIAGSSWRIHDVSSMPGSSFKPFTALTAISAVLQRSDPDLRRLLLGVPETDARRLLGIVRTKVQSDGKCNVSALGSPSDRREGPQDDTFVVKALDEVTVLRCVTNVHEASEGGVSNLRTALLDPRNTLCKGTPGSVQIGVCEALIKSSNLYFAALASRVDRATVDAQIRRRNPADRTARVEGLAFSSVVDRLFAAKHEMNKEGRMVERPFPLLSRTDFEVPRLEASVVRLAVERQPIDAVGLLRRDLALNGIGQAVEATPVQMAAAYASLATMKIVRPSFIPRDGSRGSRGDPLEGKPLLDVPFGKEAEFAELYDSLRRGLKGVPRVGTAANFVPRISANTALLNASFMKTGTATIGTVEAGGRQTALYSAWVAGWVEPLPAAPQLSRRISFTCQVSHTRGFGGQTCGPVVDAFLSGLATAGAPGRMR